MKKGYNRTAILVRRIIAIALMALSLGCLFWPPMIALKSEYKEKLQDNLPSDREAKDNLEEKIDDIFESLEKANSEFRYYTGSELPKLSITQSKANRDAMRIYRAVKDGGLSVFETRNAVSIAAAYAKKGESFLKQTENVFEREMNQSGAYSYYLYDYLEESLDGVKSMQEKYGVYFTAARVASVAVNILFFGMIMSGVLAIVMMLLNQMNFNPLHTVLAGLCVVAYAAVILVGNSKLPEMNHSIPDDLLVPGAGLFLMPILSLAACIVYKSDRTKKSTYQGAGQIDRAAQPWQSNLRYPEQQAPMRQRMTDEWTCNTCGTKNSADAAFCMNCGGRKPVPQKPTGGAFEAWTCAHCGTENLADASFYENCGARKPVQQPKAAFCAYCGKQIQPGKPFCPYCGMKQE